MKAPCPPPTMPSLIGPAPDSTCLPLTIACSFVARAVGNRQIGSRIKEA
jgi:hypothetical protein